MLLVADISYFKGLGLSGRTHTSPVNLQMCPNNCGRKYTNKYLLNRHLRYECGVNKHFSCQDCGKTFTHNFNLKSHSVIVHKRIPS